MRPTVVGLVLRSIMGKFNAPGLRGTPRLPYRGAACMRPDAEAEAERQRLAEEDMTLEEAVCVLAEMDPNTPMVSRREFARLLTAVTIAYPERMDDKVEKTTLRAKLFHACSYAQFQWFMNGLHFRATLDRAIEGYLGVGTTRNEQFHHRLNSHYRSTIFVSRRMLAAQLNTWLTTEMAVFERAVVSNPTRIIRRADAMCLVTSSAVIFGARQWDEHLREKTVAWVSTPLVEQRRAAKRPTQTALQAGIYDAIRSRTVKRRRLTVFAPQG